MTVQKLTILYGVETYFRLSDLVGINPLTTGDFQKVVFSSNKCHLSFFLSFETIPANLSKTPFST